MIERVRLVDLKTKNHRYIGYNLPIILGEYFWIKNYILLFKQNHMMILDLHEILVIYKLLVLQTRAINLRCVL